jgi:hypothetical protein
MERHPPDLAADGEAVNAILIEAAATVAHFFEYVRHLLEDTHRAVAHCVHTQAQVRRILGFDGG